MLQSSENFLILIPTCVATFLKAFGPPLHSILVRGLLRSPTQTPVTFHLDGALSTTALGPFDFLRGGQIILWDLGLVIDFLPGSTILIPSTIVHHSNTTIQANEARYSFTQYAAGRLFRWVKNVFCSNKTYVEKATKNQLREHEEARKGQWKDGVGMFSKLSELSLAGN
jgi:hypothetical protein